MRRRVAAATLAVSVGLGLALVDGAAPAPVDAACSIGATLRLGSRGDAVRCLQTTLIGAGYDSGPVDGAFGSVTYRATAAFQRARGLVVDGVVGPQTGAPSASGVVAPARRRRQRSPAQRAARAA